ncbi:MAG: DUF4834 family protein [Bacteroidaceae bacterium]|nr:DUF4834 family protein [Bacteroidaceae bacterium]
MLIAVFSILFLILIILFSVFRTLLYTILNFIAGAIDSVFHRHGSKSGGGGGQTRIHTPAPPKKRIFSDKDGEYVDYEEVRED